MQFHRIRPLLTLLAALVLLAACRGEQPQTVPTLAAPAIVPPAEPTAPPPTSVPPTAAPATAEPTSEPTAEPTAAPTESPAATPEPAADLPPGVFYDLGDATIIQANFPEDSRFREMPVRLNGVMAVPGSGEGPFPVVLILHGTHPGCPVNDMGVDAWPCDPEVEQDNYAGFEYLVRELAARGYVALAININAENTFGFGEPVAGERLLQIVDLHLSALAEAVAGGANNFGVELAGVANTRQLTLMGHSRGGDAANWLAGDYAGGPNLASPLAYANYGYGPVNGVLLIAPAVALFGSEGTSVPLATIISNCDGDIIDGTGQIFYEAVRLDEGSTAPATSVVLAGANHNAFNSILGGDLFLPADRPDCQTLLGPAAQRQFLVDYAADFLTLLDSPDPAERLDTAGRLGLGANDPAPAEIYGQPVRLSSLAAATDRLPLFTPAAEADLTTNLLGGAIVAEGLSTHFCEAGYSTPTTNPGSEPCLRPNVTIPGYPYMMVAGWGEPGAALRFELPEGQRDLSRFTTVSLRAAIDPLSPRNAPGDAQVFTLRLTDGAGNTAAAVTRPDEPALAFPPGDTFESDFFGPTFTRLVPLATVRLPLADFAGVDLADVAEIALMFEPIESGNLFLGDLELIRPPHVIGAYSTLLENADGQNDALSGVARVNGATTCSGAFVAPVDAADAPAYVLTNGHCAQDWDANRVIVDQEPGDGWRVTFNYFIDTPEAAVTVPVRRVAYSTMKGRDVALLELDTTVGDLTAQGITPVGIAAAAPDGQFDMRVVGAPVTGVPAGVAFLRQERCRAGGRADLFEFTWHFTDAIPNVCQDIYGGSSGSPAFIGDEPAIVGLINTTNIGGVTPCGLGVPCEVWPEGTALVRDTSYATPVVGLNACFDDSGAFDLAAPECPLDPGNQLLISGYPTQGTRNPVENPDGTAATATWNATLAGDLTHFRYKIIGPGEPGCREDIEYSPVYTLAERDLIDEPLPAEEGSYLLCVLAGMGELEDETWQPAEFATQVRVEVDNTPPALTPELSILRDEFGGLRFEPIFAPPELSDFVVKFGPAGETDCADPEGFLRYRRFPFDVPAEQMPARLCVIGFDSPGNAGEVLDVVVGN